MASANLNIMIKAARKAGRSLVKDFREVETSGQRQGRRRFRHPRRPRIRTRHQGRTAHRPPELRLAGRGKPAPKPARTRPGAGSSIRWTGPPTSCTACRIGRSASRWKYKGDQSSLPWFRRSQRRMFTAERGDGAFRNDRRIRSRPAPDDRIDLCHRRAFGGRGTCPPPFATLAWLMPLTAGVRRWGLGLA